MRSSLAALAIVLATAIPAVPSWAQDKAPSSRFT
jgi:hypothetical protein